MCTVVAPDTGSGDQRAARSRRRRSFIALLEWAFQSGTEPPCFDAADVDDDGVVFPLIDALYLGAWAFLAGPVPPTPGPNECGIDATEDETDCATASQECR